MNLYDWYKIFNKTEFENTGLTSRTYTLNLVGLGVKNILATKGNSLSILYDGIFLSINLNDNNPFTIDQRAVYLDANNDVWLGIEK